VQKDLGGKACLLDNDSFPYLNLKNRHLKLCLLFYFDNKKWFQHTPFVSQQCCQNMLKFGWVVTIAAGY
jgi:hypothetical protein